MSLLIGFDSSKVQDNFGNEESAVLSTGQYRMTLTDVVEQESRNTGELFVRWTWTVIGGPSEGVTIECLHFPNSGKDPDLSMKIFQGHTKSLCRALGLSQVSDYSDMMNKPVLANVQKRQYTDKYGQLQQVNSIRSFESDKTNRTTPTPNPTPATSATTPPPREDDFDDDIPF